MRHLLLATLAAASLGAAPALAQYQYQQPYTPPPPPYSYNQPADPYPNLVAGWYRTYLNRDPEPGAVEGWLDQLRAGSPPEAVEAQIAGSQEAWTKAGGTPAAFLQNLFQKVASRRPYPDELRYWTNQMSVQSPVDVARAVITKVRSAPAGTAPPRPAYPVTGYTSGYYR